MEFAHSRLYPESLNTPRVGGLLIGQIQSLRSQYVVHHRRKLSPCYQQQVQTSTVLLPPRASHSKRDEKILSSSEFQYFSLSTKLVIYGIPLVSRIKYRIEGRVIHDNVYSWLTRVFKPRTNSTAACTTGLGGPSVFPSPDSIANFTTASTFSITLSLSNACSRTGPPFAKPN